MSSIKNSFHHTILEILIQFGPVAGLLRDFQQTDPLEKSGAKLPEELLYTE